MNAGSQLAAVNHPAVKAVIPGWSDFDSYPSPMRPYGLLARGLMKTWSDLVGAMDRNDGAALGSTVRPVDEDKDGSLLRQALADHSKNPNVFNKMSAAEYRNDDLGGGATWETIGPIHYKAEIERSKVPMLVFASWLDAGTVDGSLFRFQHFTNPQKVSDSLPADVQIAGTPVVTLRLSSDRADGAVLVYLEDVGPDGRSRYLTEGGLRLIHRKLVPNPYAKTDVPYHSFARSDARPMTPGKAEEVTFQLWPIAARIRQGHRIRVAIAGGDQNIFDPIPADGNASLTVVSGAPAGSPGVARASGRISLIQNPPERLAPRLDDAPLCHPAGHRRLFLMSGVRSPF